AGCPRRRPGSRRSTSRPTTAHTDAAPHPPPCSRSDRTASAAALRSGAMPGGGLRLAVTLLTAVPVRDEPGEVPARRAGAAMSWAPVIGLLLGAAAAAVLWILSHYAHAGPLLAAVISVAVLALLTRGLHLDGLADLADGLGSGQPAGAAL